MGWGWGGDESAGGKSRPLEAHSPTEVRAERCAVEAHSPTEVRTERCAVKRGEARRLRQKAEKAHRVLSAFLPRARSLAVGLVNEGPSLRKNTQSKLQVL